ncbi:Putative tetratricopeptide-like helical domain superfamily [Septoria linicola]|uniref:Tetratricopeptide-like helical domain superfamily n=1 Tax=Septoria linicola TaxID=215465 RepID=A0A9Q9EHS0_9PEZI|nr:putative tetratricopeptide-like helical domain superfamily [Septoria linicola]USW50309.1 Putative tetratricopeptide-like helical domain superfamily [Septoria linicola]
MNNAKLAIDPLWPCLCPPWATVSLPRTTRVLSRSRLAAGQQQQCLQQSTWQPHQPRYARMTNRNGRGYSTSTHVEPSENRAQAKRASRDEFDIEHEATHLLYGRLRAMAARGKVIECRHIAEYLVQQRREKPNIQLYNALIVSNVRTELGAAWRVHDLLDEMREAGLQPDVGTCHAVLKVLSIHLDHLLRTEILDYMHQRWFQLTEDGWHDRIAGMLREGLFEQALERLDKMRRERMQIEPWLNDMAVFVLCDAGEIEEAFRIMRTRYDAGELTLRQAVWAYLLDKGSEARHHNATSFVWMSQVNQGYLNASSGTCLNVLATAAQAGDAPMATEVFTHLSKRGSAFKPIHYELLMSAYLSASPPDLGRAISILTIMPLEKLEPTIAQTRSIFVYIKDKPALIKQALSTLRDLHTQGRKISITILNLLIECYIEQKNLPEAMKIYKLIHTFAPVGHGAQKSFANVETFNLLLKGCRVTTPPDEQQTSFLVSELLALRVVPTAMTYDRLILCFIESARYTLRNAASISDPAAAKREYAKGVELVDWSFRHFADMQPLGWMPRFGTLEMLAVQLARVGDDRCWDVLQAAEDQGEKVEGFDQKGRFARKNVEEAWMASQEGREGMEREESISGHGEGVAATHASWS